MADDAFPALAEEIEDHARHNPDKTPLHSRRDYLIECLRNSHDESMRRISYRDNYLKLQLAAQVILFSVSQGIELEGFKTSNHAMPDVLSLAPLISAILYVMYYIENSLIGGLSRYIANLSLLEQKLSGGIFLPNWDASNHYRKDYMHSTLPFRTLVQLLSFVILPLVLCASRYVHLASYDGYRVEIGLNMLITIIIVGLIFSGHQWRQWHLIVRDILPKKR